MTARKPKAKAPAKAPADEFIDKHLEFIVPEGQICISKEQLTSALNDNFVRMLGSHPVVDQVDDLWRRLSEG